MSCEFCNSGDYELFRDGWDGEISVVFHPGERPAIMSGDPSCDANGHDSLDVTCRYDISYCPFCGRKLD